MKKLTLITVITIFAMTAYAGFLTSIGGFNAKEVKPDAFYTVDVVGQNVRVYEWTTQTEPKMKCVAMFTESATKSPSMQCIPIK